MPVVAPAISEPATRRSVRRRWLNVVALAIAACGLLLIAGWEARSDANAHALQRNGAQADATIVAVVAQPVGRGRFPSGSVRVRFEAANQIRENSVYVGRSVGGFRLNQRVTVVYDTSDPSRVEILGLPSPGQGVPAVLALIGALPPAGMAIAGARRARQIERVVRREPWQVATSRLVQFPFTVGLRHGSRTLVELQTSAGTVSVEPVGFSRVDPRFEPEVWVAGLDAKAIVLAAPGGSHVVAARQR